MNGYVWDEINYINHTYGAYFSTRVNTGQATKIVNSVTINAYGSVGSGGVGKIYSKTLSGSNTNQNYLYVDLSGGYSGIVAYTSKYAQAKVTNQYGTFTISTY